MAYMSQERKREIVALCKPILKKYGIRGTFSVDNRSTLVCNLKAGKIDFGTDFVDVNVYHHRNQFTGDALSFLTELIDAMNTGNHDNSDIQTDYFDVGWYVYVHVGRWNKPYILEG
jgi:hypothetical protein